MHTIYDQITGKILAYKSDKAYRNRPGEWSHPGRHDARSWYFVDGILTARPDMGCQLDKSAIVADGQDVATLSGVPVGANVRFGNQSTVADDSSMIELIAHDRGVLQVKVTLWPYKDWETAIEAN